jgi:hypothetical protein
MPHKEDLWAARRDVLADGLAVPTGALLEANGGVRDVPMWDRPLEISGWPSGHLGVNWVGLRGRWAGSVIDQQIRENKVPAANSTSGYAGCSIDQLSAYKATITVYRMA